MKYSEFALATTMMVASPVLMCAQSEVLGLSKVVSPTPCVAAAQSVREWGWTDGGEDNVSLSTIVSAVNRQLRINEGQLPAKDIEKLHASAFSADPCVRELSVNILRTQTRVPARKPHRTLALVRRGKESRDLFAPRAPRNSVTRSLEKQSPTREAITP
jgi:hypothetical protein